VSHYRFLKRTLPITYKNIKDLGPESTFYGWKRRYKINMEPNLPLQVAQHVEGNFLLTESVIFIGRTYYLLQQIAVLK
jgi:hypothetical protein